MKIKPYLKQVRRISQLLCLFLFLFLFRQTDYSGSDTLDYAVNILFRLDPLVLATMVLAKKAVFALLWPSLIVVGLTLFLGRVFCSWICPMGTLIDISGHMIPVGNKKVQLRYLKYCILVVTLIGAPFGFQLIGFADPFSLLVRGMSFTIDPMMNFLVCGFFDSIYVSGPQWVSNMTEPVYGLFKTFILPFRQSFFYLSFLSFVCLIVIFILEFWGKRFWCRNLCPLGALLALISKCAFLKRIPIKACKNCELCQTACPMDAVKDDKKLLFEECNLCMNCLEFCPNSITTFKFGIPKAPSKIDISRRKLITAGVVGLALPAIARTQAISKMPDNDLIRPPGALDEADFLATCVRCGECMKVCIKNGLQPLFMEKGIEGMFTPKLVPRLGYCEYNCTLCSQVCPTGAIQRLDLKQKHAFVMGKAYFDLNRCLVYAKKQLCIVCEEHCPIHDKAIKFTKVMIQNVHGENKILKQPYVVEKNCIGCGICEYVCPVPGESAIRVVGKSTIKASLDGYG